MTPDERFPSLSTVRLAGKSTKTPRSISRSTASATTARHPMMIPFKSLMKRSVTATFYAAEVFLRYAAEKAHSQIFGVTPPAPQLTLLPRRRGGHRTLKLSAKSLPLQISARASLNSSRRRILDALPVAGPHGRAIGVAIWHLRSIECSIPVPVSDGRLLPPPTGGDKWLQVKGWHTRDKLSLRHAMAEVIEQNMNIRRQFSRYRRLRVGCFALMLSPLAWPSN